MTNEIRELNLNELASVSGGTDPLRLLATVSHLQASNANDALAGALTGALGGAGTKGPSRKIG
ncbi:Blp family class II bacteriocin [Bradyrhizobium sp. AUGA SZCCT0177]|uniref:Blp family class II bacteriocin n=1 Tax=Bradyrhizobium sp. AUGA SZCCT0177 TaxID=2807665 RepID=UPI001BA5C1A4|nr:Blp family class II bacteriocin [Bradyrhizobium sp. AUGA SZCCT0177]MBR1286726.1 Blp family class II bacteriocin [Bradyrhizobium sp. AUGA SZCCT0177]